jgi:hypothetical protein
MRSLESISERRFSGRFSEQWIPDHNSTSLIFLKLSLFGFLDLVDTINALLC